jgi:Domain of unknown function (DUF4398)
VPALLCALLVCAACSEPPQKEMSEAQGAIDAARAAGAEQYATAEYRAATAALKESQDAVQQRDYRLALSRAIDASQRAQEAAKRASESMATARSDAQVAINTAAAALQQLETRLKAAETARVPARDIAGATKVAARAQTDLQKARASVSAADYLAAAAAVKDTTATLTKQIGAVDEAIAARAKGAPRRRRSGD